MTEEKSMVDALIQNPFGEDVVKNTCLLYTSDAADE